MKKLIIIMAIFMVCIGVIAKKYDNRDAERMQGYKILKVGSDKYIMASSNNIHIATISDMKDGCSSVSPSPKMPHYSENNKEMLKSRTIALLRYKTLIYWVVEKYDNYNYTIQIQSFLTGKESIGSDAVTLISMGDPFVMNRPTTTPSNFTGAFIQENKFYFLEDGVGDVIIKIYAADPDGAPYFDFSNQSNPPNSYIEQPDNCSRLLEMYVKPMAAGGDRMKVDGDLITVWLKSKDHGVTFGVYRPSGDGFQSTPYYTATGLTDYAPRGHIPYYGAKILDLPMASYSENASDMTVFVSYCFDKGAFNSVKQYIGAFKVVYDNNNTVSEIKYVGDIYKDKTSLKNLDILIEPENDNDEGTHLNYRIMAGNWISISAICTESTTRPGYTTSVDYSLKTDKTKAGYLKNGKILSFPGLDPLGLTNTERESYSDFCIVPIGIIYLPPIVLPYDPENLDDDELSIKEIYDDPDMMQNLYKYSDKDSFIDETGGKTRDETIYNKCKWLFLLDKTSFLDKIKNDNVWSLGLENSESVSLEVSKETSVGLKSDCFKETAALTVTNSNSSNTGSNNEYDVKKTWTINQSKETNINNFAIFLFWEYPIADQKLYRGTLKKNKSTDYFQNGTRSFSVIIPMSPPILNQNFFNPNEPGKNPYYVGIQPVPKTYSIDKIISKTSEYDYLYNWKIYLNDKGNDKGNNDALLETEFTDQNTETLWARGISSSEDLKIALTLTHSSTTETSIGNSGGVAIGVPMNDYFPGSINSSLTNAISNTSSTCTSNATEMSWDVTGQSRKQTNISHNDLKFPALSYDYYMIQERAPRADKQDWWVATKWREQGIAPWVMYYDFRGNISSTKR